jgi:TRAP-type uncharacterized transport system fused permease subunit
VGLLFEGTWTQVLIAFTTSVFAVGALAVVTGSWLVGPAKIPERVLFLVAAVALLVMEPLWIGVGAAFMAAGVAVHLIGLRRGTGAGTAAPGAPGTRDTSAPTAGGSSAAGQGR